MVSLHRINPRRDKAERQIVSWFTDAGCRVFQASGKGLPDLLGVSPLGVFFLIEVKSKYGKLTASQKDFFSIVRALDAPAFIVRDKFDVDLVLESLAELAPRRRT